MPINTLYQDGDNAQLRGVIFDATPTAIAQTKQIAQQFKGKTELETCRNIFNFLKQRIRYKEDGFHQKVKLPSALIRERVADCKSYSVFTYAILTNLGIPCKYVLTSYNSDPTPSHIYVCTDSGIIIDAVYGKFNAEKKPTHKFYKKVNDMRISTISGIKGGHIKGNCNSCSTIGATEGDSNKWYKDNKSTLGLNTGDKANNIAKKIGLAPMRGLFRKFIEQNGGGVATAIYRKVYVKTPIEQAIPQGLLNDLKASYTASAKSKGVKFPDMSQWMKIQTLSSVQVSADELDKLVKGEIVITPTGAGSGRQARFTFAQAWDRVLGSGQYNKHQLYYLKPYNKAYEKLYAEYSIPASKQSDINAWKQLLKQWYRYGGNPYELKESVMEGKSKTPRGKDANYLLMVAKTRGLKPKDLGLMIRGFVSAFGGDRFQYGEKDTYIFGYKNSGGIGAEPVSTTATITAYATLISTLFALLSKIWTFVEGKIEESKAKKEMVSLETNGWILEGDYLKMNLPRPLVKEVKQISVPTFDAPDLENIGSAIEELEAVFKGVDGKKTSYTPQTKAEYESKKKEGAFSPLLNNAIEEANKDKGTADYLKLVSSVDKAIPPTGETIVTYLKLGELPEMGGKQAGFGGIILPLLIGGGVLMALNTAKKQKK